MTLEGFITEKKLEIEAFERWWIKNHEENPNNFPLELGPGDWDEQLQLFDIEMT